MALAVVGEALISASVEILLNRIASRDFRDFFSSTKLNVSLLEDLNLKLLELKVVLNDAEEKQITVPEVKAWLDELKDAVYDAEDLLDEINTESLRCNVEGESKKFHTKLRSLLSSHFKKFTKSMNSRLEQLCTRLERFVSRIDNFGLQSVSRRVSSKTSPDSLVESVIIARKDEKENLVKMLLSYDDDDDDDDEKKKKKNIEVITIWGMGGLGKTTLAQSLYNHSEVRKHFDVTAWAWVSDDFDVFRVTKKIVESLTSKDCPIINPDVLRVELKNSLRDKKFLLVLDDLWNDKYDDWNRLVAPFSSGKQGSRIIVTTRNKRVAQVTHSLPICELKRLTDEDCWKILARHAFGDGGYDNYPGLEEVGRKIALKCKGLPLAAKTLGGLLRSNVNVEEWNTVLSSNLWAHDDVLPALRISYFHLPAHIKRCFAYCSIFPRQHLLDRKELILLWMAEGFLQQIHEEKAMESTGKQDALRIRELGRFSRLQGKLSIQELQNVVDCMDAFQAYLKQKEKIEELNLEWGSGPQDAQTVIDVLDNLQPSTNLKKLSIRAFGGTSFPKWMGDSSYSKVTVLCISDCNYCLSFPPFGQLPSLKQLVIKRMKGVKIVGHEFYCNNRGSPPFQPFPLLESLQFEEMLKWKEWLPFEGEDSNFPFPCLKRLSLSNCPKLRGSLPRSLPSLKEVSISKCNQLEAKSCDLHWNTSIEVIYTRESGEGLLSLLDNFSCQELLIEKCDSLQSLPRMMIVGPNCFQKLVLKKISSLISFPTNGLPTSLKSLDIEDCGNLEFLSHETWHKYTSLEELRIWDSCRSLTSFPLDSFPALEYLHIHGCPRLEVITTQHGEAASKLVYFIVADCEKLKSLPQPIDLPVIKGLWLYRLPELASLFPRHLPTTLQFLSVDVGMLSSMSKHELGWLFQRLTFLSCLRICGLGEEDLVNSLLQEQLLPTSLQFLCLHSFNGLKLLEGEGIRHLTSLQKLHVWHCGSLESLPEDQLPSSLELLSIHDCPLLEARYVGRKGKQWSKIAHIPAIQINGEVTIR